MEPVFVQKSTQKSKQGNYIYNQHVCYSSFSIISLHNTYVQLKVKEYTTEEVAMIERATMDNAAKRALQFEAIKTIADHNKLIPTSSVIIPCLKTGVL